MRHKITVLASLLAIVAAASYSYHVHQNQQIKQIAINSQIASRDKNNQVAAANAKKAEDDYINKLQAQCNVDWQNYNKLTVKLKSLTAAPICLQGSAKY